MKRRPDHISVTQFPNRGSAAAVARAACFANQRSVGSGARATCAARRLKPALDTIMCVTLLALLAGCARSAPPGTASTVQTPQIQFVDRADTAGLQFRHRNGMTGAFLEAEIYAPGVALFDFDNDGDLDIYVVQGVLPGSTGDAARDATDRLFRNDLSVSADGRRTVHFVDVTANSRIDERSYGMAVAAADYDNDGWPDLFSARLDGDVLLHNNHDGTFTNVTARSGLASARSWGTAAAFLDIDRDGWLDLFVGNYLQYTVKSDGKCFTPAGTPDYCDPTEYQPATPKLYRNRGDGTFVDVTRSLTGELHGASLGVSTADFNGDGWLDIYVANDRQENDLWLNRHDGTFSNAALAAGVALNADGRREGSMGVDAGDFDNDGDEDLFIANFTSEGDTLYVNRGDGTFEDAGVGSGIRPASLPYTGFGAAWLDVDNDGSLDVLTVNGAVQVIERLARVGDPFPMHQPKQLFHNRGNGRFDDVTKDAGTGVQTSDVSRGAAFGDIDNDGDTDVVVGNNNGPLRLLMNESVHTGHWAGIRVVGAQGRDMIGARVLVTHGGRTIYRRARSDGSYASANDPRVLVGLGADATPPSVRVIWTDGRTESFSSVPVDHWTLLREGTGK
jgi:enediyne biosynthesis protein E4